MEQPLHVPNAFLLHELAGPFFPARFWRASLLGGVVAGLVASDVGGGVLTLDDVSAIDAADMSVRIAPNTNAFISPSGS
jgi:hypothetical protein